MKPKTIYLLLAALLVTISPAEGQSTKKRMPRIGFLVPGSSSSYSARIEAFRQGLQVAGYTDGENITIDYRYADGKFERFPELINEILRLNVDLVITGDTPAIKAVKDATTTIPIVMGNVADPVAVGLVASLARPGGNVTGLTTLATDLDGKRLELLREIIPKLTRVAFLWDPSNPAMRTRFKEVQAASQSLEIRLQSLEIRSANDLQNAFEQALRERAGGLMAPNTVVLVHGKEIADFAAKNRLPLVYDTREFAETGGLMSYGPSFPDLWRRAAGYVDKILKGAKPADLPVEQPTKFELVINLKTAREIGLSIPPNMLARADRLIR